MFIIPVEGRRVRDPATQRIVGDDGLTIDPTDPYWLRRLEDGDVLEAPEPAPEVELEPESPPPAPTKAAKGAATSQEPLA